MANAQQSASTLDQIRTEIQAGIGVQEYLDGMVHDQASQLATAVNNDGLQAQLSFLTTRGLTVEDILDLLRSANS